MQLTILHNAYCGGWCWACLGGLALGMHPRAGSLAGGLMGCKGVPAQARVLQHAMAQQQAPAVCCSALPVCHVIPMSLLEHISCCLRSTTIGGCSRMSTAKPDGILANAAFYIHCGQLWANTTCRTQSVVQLPHGPLVLNWSSRIRQLLSAQSCSAVLLSSWPHRQCAQDVPLPTGRERAACTAASAR